MTAIPSLHEWVQLTQIIFYVGTLTLGILSFIAAWKTVFVPFKTEIFKYRLQSLNGLHKLLNDRLSGVRLPGFAEESNALNYLLIVQAYCEIYLGATNSKLSASLNDRCSSYSMYGLTRADDWELAEIDLSFEKRSLGKEVDSLLREKLRQFSEKDGLKRRYEHMLNFFDTKAEVVGLVLSKKHSEIIETLDTYSSDLVLSAKMRKALENLKAAVWPMLNPIAYYQEVIDSLLKKRPTLEQLDFRADLVPDKISADIKKNFERAKKELTKNPEKAFEVYDA